MLTDERDLARTGLDAAALKPTECDVARAADLPLETLVVDYEGPEHVPDPSTLRRLADDHAVRLTTPVRADAFDPLHDGDPDPGVAVPDAVGRVIVAGNPAYLSEREADRAVAPRLAAAREAHPDAWVGTENVERVALAVGGTQFELLSRTTERDVRALRAAGVDAPMAVYAPTVPATDDDAVLDAVGEYVARRRPVARALPEGAPTDAGAAGRAREVLLAAAEDYALVGSAADIGGQVDRLRAAGVDVVVGYPAAGLETFLG